MPRDWLDLSAPPALTGLFARAALYRLIKTAEIECTASESPHPKIAIARCRTAEGPLSDRLVRLGWATPLAEASDLGAAAEEARRKHLGIWAETAPRIGDQPAM